MIDKRTTIQVKGSTKERLANIGKKGDTFDDLINMLLDLYDSNN